MNQSFPNEKLVKIGLPIRHDFALEAERLGDRWSPEGQAYQRGVRQALELMPHDILSYTRDWSEVLRVHSHMKTSKSTDALSYCNPISTADD